METTEFLTEAVAVLAAAVAVVLASARLRVPPVVGFLISGMLIGPSGLALVPETEQVEVFAEIGVVLLLFVIGMQLNSAAMKSLGRSFLVGGTLQWALTAGLVMAIVVGLGLPPANALFAGFVVSLSSTAVVLKQYQERREATSTHGKVVLGVLLLQDLLIVPMIALTPVLAGSVTASPASLALRFGGGLAAVALVFIAGRLLIRQLTRLIVATGIRELFVLAALTLCLAMAWFTAQLEFSLALGAFLAGVLVAETEYSYQMIADIGPFRDVFASIFFVSIGMLVDLPFTLLNLPLLLGLAGLLILCKALVAAAAIRLAGFPGRIAVICGIGLAQIGEFSFVLMETGRQHGLLQGDRFQILLVAAVLTVALTPLLIRIAPAVGARLFAAGRHAGPESAPQAEPSRSSHVIVVGYGLAGSLLARILGETHIPYLVVELDPEKVRRARADGVSILFGDAARREILEQAGVEVAKIVVFAISDYDTVQRSLKAVRELAPEVQILVRTGRFEEIAALRRAGADMVVAEEFESAIEIFTRVLTAYHVPRNVIRAETRVLRGEGYKMLRSEPVDHAFDAVLKALKAGTTDIYQIAADGPAAGRTLRELELRGRTGANVIAVVRGERPHPSPSSELRLEAGDSLVLVGSHEAIDHAFGYLDDPTVEMRAD